MCALNGDGASGPRSMVRMGPAKVPMSLDKDGAYVLSVLSGMALIYRSTRSGQCVTSADCASRVPYCSKLGFCHGGRLPFDEEQLEIPDEVFAQEPSERPQGWEGIWKEKDCWHYLFMLLLIPPRYINNDVQKNSPLFLNNERAGPDGSRPRQQRRRGQETTRQQSRAAAVNQSYQNRNCPEQSQEACVANACQSVSHLNRVFEICSNECRKRCAWFLFWKK